VFSSRDHQNVGTLDDGLNEKDVDLAVEVGDFIGLRLPPVGAGDGIELDYDAGWTNDYWRTLAASSFPYESYEFDNLGLRIISIYGELERGGAVGGLGPGAIAAVIGV